MGAFEELFAGPDAAAPPTARPMGTEAEERIAKRLDELLARPQLELVSPPSAAAAPAPAPSSLRFEFFVAGEPKGKGSKRAFVNKATGRPILTDKHGSKEAEAKLYSWEHAVTTAAFRALGSRERINHPVIVELTFYLARPSGHFNKKGQLKPSAPKHHGSKPDGDKLMRATVDSLKVAMLSDDSRAWRKLVEKHYVGENGTRETGCRIVVQVTP